MHEIHPTKKLIFEVIAHLLAEGGVEKVTYTNISERAYLQRASIAYYFDNRQDMLLKFFEHFLSSINPAELVMELLETATDDPVADFCRLIDTLLLDHGMQDPGIKSIFRHVLASSLSDPQAKRLLLKNNERTNIILREVLDYFIKKGIIEEDRIETALSDIYAYAACSSFMVLFDFEIPWFNLAEKAMVERVKRALLKDGLYPPAAP